MNDVKNIIAKNLSALRQKHNLTQTQLAERINYTDKSISKWENAETLPPVDVLKDIADVFGVTLDFLTSENDEESFDKRYDLKENVTNKIIITLLSASIVWLIATILYVYGLTFAGNNLWLLFVGAVPITCIVLLAFNGIWGKRKFIFILVSILQWSIIATAFLFLLIYKNMIAWPIFILGVPLQIGIVLWSLLKPSRKS